MRADRLVAIVLLLQVRGQLTAAELAQRLEISERTVRRDLEALCIAGVPLYAERGRGGGWRLLGGNRIDLSGLTVDEARALFLATSPSSAVPGSDHKQALVAARRKVLAALPEVLRSQVEVAEGAVLFDDTRWGSDNRSGRGEEAHSGASTRTREDLHLTLLRSAVFSGVEVVVNYEPPGRPPEDRRVKPHGLVCKRDVWYLVASAPAGLRTYRLSRVRSVVVTDEPFERPAGFDLGEVWSVVQDSFASRIRDGVEVEIAVEDRFVDLVRTRLAWWPIELFDTSETSGAPTQARVCFPSVEIAAAELIGFVDHVTVQSPREVARAMTEMADRLLDKYQQVHVLAR
ncbi:MAG: WYL domain-containing protein [Actinobacteria bacterium]|nr:WYL domain-containing protein [Actinomycetota bacterium]MCL5445168.1 WYL domain-containing protein [Actinomycetota bacterium]